MSDIALPSSVAAPAAARPVAVTAIRAAAAVSLHVAATAVLAWVIDPVISETAFWAWPSAVQVEQFWLLWAQTTAAPALVWTALVLARAASRRRVEGTWSALSAIVVAIVAFALAVPLIVLQVPVQATGIALSSCILAACAGVVVIAAQVAHDRRAAAARGAAAHGAEAAG
ncbi:hypothetical protein [Agrococcus terreus]|uniref:Uncharacterized protein n=1 Tax=Agrococcus terreus TaxID=574649 RepID=A0ABQ2KPB6_9MICO|nr:hypothetical protein [Agrococcus terreus]GGN89192.1 hypothetical protein GCM10010968_25590 [Agrococcus terreus]